MMEWFKDLFMNPFLLAGVSGWFVAQVVKTIIYAIINKKEAIGREVPKTT